MCSSDLRCSGDYAIVISHNPDNDTSRSFAFGFCVLLFVYMFRFYGICVLFIDFILFLWKMMWGLWNVRCKL